VGKTTNITEWNCECTDRQYQMTDKEGPSSLALGLRIDNSKP